ARHPAAPGRQALGYRLQLQDPGLFPRQLARLQHRARPYAVGFDRREPRQPRADLPRRLRRRRLGIDRPGAVRAHHAPRREHDLHPREQRRVRPDQRPVLRHRRRRLDFWPSREAINVEYNEGDAIEVPQHDGSIIRLRKTHPDYDPTDRVQALEYVAHHAAKGEVVTGLLYLDTNSEDLHAHLNTVE